MSRVDIVQFEEHLPGEEDYRVLSRVGRRREGRVGGRSGRWVLLTSTIGAAGLDAGLSAALAPWRPANATHDPAKVLLDLALSLALAGNACSDLRENTAPTFKRGFGFHP